MANFNSVPTGDNSANNGDYTPESFSNTDDTVQLPKLDEHIESLNGDNTPDVLPATDQEQNSPEDNNHEHKSHLGCNLVVGGVAVALAFSAWMFSKNGDNVNPAPDVFDTPATTEGHTDNGIIDEPEESIDNNMEIHSGDSADRLLASQVINDYMTVNGGVDTMMASEYIEDWLYDNGYITPSVVAVNEADYILGGTGRFHIQANDRNSNVFRIRFSLTADGMVDIDIHDASSVEGDNSYAYTSDSIPTADEAREITMQNLQ